MVPSRQLMVLVTGSVPGVGKSSLALAVTRALEGDRQAELFREEDIRTDSAFRLVMDEFESMGDVRLETLLRATATYLESVAACPSDAVVLDALFPYLPSLLAWGYTDEEIATFFVLLARLFVGFEVIELHLVGDSRRALARATEREDRAWLDGHIAKASGFRTVRPISTLDDVVAYYDHASARSRALLTEAPWPVVLIDADIGEANAVATAIAAIMLNAACVSRDNRSVQFSADLRDRVADGSITVSYRLWSRPQVKVGGVYRSGSVMIAIDDIDMVPFSSITAEDLARTGEADIEALRRRAAHAGPIHDDTLVYRVEFHVVRQQDHTRR